MRVDVPEYGTFIDFPDNTPPDVITKAMNDNFPAKKPASPPAGEKPTIATQGKKLLYNIPGSAWNVAKGTASALFHPIDTIKGMGELAAGGVAAGLREMLPEKAKSVPMSGGEKAFREGISYPIEEALKNPSGVPGRIVDYTVNHPVEQLMNVSGGLGITGKVSGISKLSKASEWTNPINLIAKPTAAGVDALTNKLTASGVTPAIIEKLKLAQDTGVPLTPADITGKKSHAILEMQLKENIGSANKGAASVSDKAVAVTKYAEQLKRDMGGSMDKLSAGQITQEATDKLYKAFQKKASTLYGEVPVFPNEMLDTKNLSQVAAEHLDELGKINNGAIKRVLATVGNEQEGYRPKPYLWKEMIADQQELRKMAVATGDFNKKRIYYDLVSSINADISDFAKSAKNPEIKKALDAAVSFYRDGDATMPGIKTFRDRQIMNMTRTNSPEDIVRNFIKASPNTSDMSRLREVAGPKGWNAIKRAWLTDMTSMGDQQSFSPAKFATAYDKYRQGGNLGTMLNGSERAGLDKLYEVSKIINTAEKVAGNPSGTGRMYMNAAAHWVAHPVIQTVTQIGANRMAELYFNNPTFQKFLIQGLDASGKSSKAIVAANELSKIASQSASTNIMFQTGRLTNEDKGGAQ